MPDQQEMPDVVYHYTSMDTLLKIVQSKQIWATNIRYLNDVLERQHYLSLTRTRILSLLNEYPSWDKDNFNSTLYSDEATKQFHDLPFVASFSLERDSLPQWRSYCPNGNGVSIGFRTESLRNATAGLPLEEEPSAWSFAPFISFNAVRYLDASDIQTIDTMIHTAMTEAKASVQEMEDDEFPSSFDEDQALWYAFDKYASLTKHSSFSAEREYRLLITALLGFGRLVKFRSSRSTLIPYIPLDLPNPSGHLVPKMEYPRRGVVPYFIDSVTIGPTPHLDLSADAVNGVFLGQDVNVTVDIFKSNVPFRDL